MPHRRQTTPALPSCSAGNSLTSHIQPDAIFGLTLAGAAKLFMLEIDNGTMPVLRRTPYQTSLLRKLLGYAQTHKTEIYRTRFGMANLRVLFVVPTRERADMLLRALRELVVHPGSNIPPRLFLVIDQPSLHGAEDGFLLAKWRDAKGAELLLFE